MKDNTIQLNTPPYRKLVWQMLLMLVLITLIAFWRWDNLALFFESTRIGALGWVLTSFTIILFLLGYIRIIILFIDYEREQTAMEIFQDRCHKNISHPAEGLPKHTLIIQRFLTIQSLARHQNTPINQSALAAMVSANQASRFTLVRFVQSIIILTGILGTMVSLSVVLLGASNLLSSKIDIQIMGTIIGGMSTALVTTVTAIIFYVLFSYYHMRLQDVRNQLLVNLENITTLYLLPHFPTDIQSAASQELLGLTKEMRESASTLHQAQNQLIQMGEKLQTIVDNMQDSFTHSRMNLQTYLQSIRELIREGFRLQDDKSNHTDDNKDNTSSH